MIFVEPRDPRLVTLRRGGSLTDAHHRLLALWAADCAEHVLAIFAAAAPDDDRPRAAIANARAWASGTMTTREALRASAANAAAMDVRNAPRFAARAAAQSVAVSHVAAHALGAAAYALRAVAASEDSEAARRRERDWQRGRLPDAVRDLVIDDQRLRNHVCWGMFAD